MLLAFASAGSGPAALNWITRPARLVAPLPDRAQSSFVHLREKTKNDGPIASLQRIQFSSAQDTIARQAASHFLDCIEYELSRGNDRTAHLSRFTSASVYSSRSDIFPPVVGTRPTCAAGINQSVRLTAQHSQRLSFSLPPLRLLANRPLLSVKTKQTITTTAVPFRRRALCT